MQLATIDNGSPDGRLVLVSPDHQHCTDASHIAANLLEAMSRWAQVAPALEALAKRLANNEAPLAPFEDAQAPLPRTWQWLDGSAFAQHGLLMQQAFKLPPIESDKPLMYQGMSDLFYSGTADVAFRSEQDGIDFEGEFAVITDAVPMGVSPAAALQHIKLIIQLNDWSLRSIAPVEMKTGFGWVQAKPACSVAPVAITPAELGDHWRDGRVCLPLLIELNEKLFGCANGSEMAYGFHELVAHAAATRSLVAGTIIGSGTVSNADYARVGSSCISERRAIGMIEFGEAKTPFMHFGDRIKMQATRPDGRPLFGDIDQRVIQNRP